MKHKIIKRMKAIILASAITVSSLGTVSFPKNIIVSRAATIKISKKKLTLTVGQSKALKITGIKEKVTWSSNKESVATVNNKGKVTAKKSGTAKITAKVAKKKYTCTVTVKEEVTESAAPTEPTELLKPTDSEISLNKSKLKNFIIANGETFSNDGTKTFYRYVHPVSEHEAIYLQYSDDMGFQLFYHQILGNKESSDTIIQIDMIQNPISEITYLYSNLGGSVILYNAKTSIDISTYNLTDRLTFSYSGVTENELTMYLKASESVPNMFKKINPVLNSTVELSFRDLGFYEITNDTLK